jgi:hypothetical protein
VTLATLHTVTPSPTDTGDSSVSGNPAVPTGEEVAEALCDHLRQTLSRRVEHGGEPRMSCALCSPRVCQMYLSAVAAFLIDGRRVARVCKVRVCVACRAGAESADGARHMQALISFFLDDGDKLRRINTGTIRITFLHSSARLCTALASRGARWQGGAPAPASASSACLRSGQSLTWAACLTVGCLLRAQARAETEAGVEILRDYFARNVDNLNVKIILTTLRLYKALHRGGICVLHVVHGARQARCRSRVRGRLPQRKGELP